MVVKRLVIFVVLMIALVAFPVLAAKRVALVIGNNDYTTLPDLNNAKKDAEGIATKLRGLQFDVILRTNAGAQSISRALADFEKRIAKADVALVYYAGHGIEANGKNHLIPSDARIEVEDDLRFGSIDSQEFLHAMKRAGSPLNIVILDACRDNPLPRRSRSAARGLTIQAIPTGIKGTAIVYSAAPGQRAEDGPKGGHGVFTAALLRVLDEPGLKLEEVFKKTARLVSASTRGRQDPWFNSSVKGDFYFKPGAPKVVGTASKKSPDVVFWEIIKNSTDPDLFKAYLRQYPKGRFARLARLKVGSKDKKSNESDIFSLTSPTEIIKKPIDLIEGMNAIYVAVKTANLREKPSAKSKKVGKAEINSGLNVTGKVKGKDWYRIAYEGNTAFVFAPLIKAIDTNELKAWDRVVKSKDAKDFESFLEAYPSGHFAEKARRLRDALKPVRVAVVTPPKSNAPSLVKPAVGIYPKRYKPGNSFKDCSDCPEMVVIPAGSFLMGDLKGEGNNSEGPVHKISISNSFAVGKHEVTQGQWRAVMGSNPSQFNGVRKPVEQVSWDDVQEFVIKLSNKTGKRYRLLSEAEWEYAARAGRDTIFHCGNALSCLEGVAWYRGNSSRSTHPVGRKKANGFGLFDMHGNVWEWVGDCWSRNYRGAATDGRMWNSNYCSRRVLRGGSWYNVPKDMRAAYRYWSTNFARSNQIGFRIARDLDVSKIMASNTNQPKQVAIVTPPPQNKPVTQSNILPPGSSDEQYRYAFNLMNIGKYEDAEKAWVEFIAKNNDDQLGLYAQFWLGETYYNLKKYRPAVESFYRSFKANPSDSKSPETLLMLAKSLVKLDKWKEACLTFQKLKDDFPNASNWIRQALYEESSQSSCSISGQIDPASPEAELATYYRKPAVAEVGANVAVARGKEAVSKGQHAEAIKWFRIAAEQGNAFGQALLGLAYAEGLGVTKDNNIALKWIRKSSQQGNPIAQSNLGWFYAAGIGVDKDYNEAHKWFRKGAEQGDAFGQGKLGWMYGWGLGVDKDYDQALKWARKSAENGDPFGQGILGLLYFSGFGVDKDYDQALKWARKSAGRGDGNGQYLLGALYMDGLGVDKNIAKGKELIGKSAAQGNPVGKQLLRKLSRWP
jgi:tol-pal system protein YbgF